MADRLFAVVVAYLPQAGQLERVWGALSECAGVVIVDNSPHASALPEGPIGLRMSGNVGIAAAQNAGIREARSRGATAIVFFDQDSQPDQAFLSELMGCLHAHPSAVVVPACKDARTGQEYPSFRLNQLGWPSAVGVLGETHPVPVDLAISSGSLVPVDVFDRVGLMEESLFIDYVDFEWCIRCRGGGVEIMAVPQAIMNHEIGNAVVRTGAITTYVHAPSRAYYRLRNPLLLFRMKHVKKLYALRESTSALLQHLLLWRYSSEKAQYARLGWRALADGIRGKGGRLPERHVIRSVERRIP